MWLLTGQREKELEWAKKSCSSISHFFFHQKGRSLIKKDKMYTWISRLYSSPKVNNFKGHIKPVTSTVFCYRSILFPNERIVTQTHVQNLHTDSASENNWTQMFVIIVLLFNGLLKGLHTSFIHIEIGFGFLLLRFQSGYYWIIGLYVNVQTFWLVM